MAVGELTHADRHTVDRAIRDAEQSSRFEFSVFVGRAQGEADGFARRLHASSVVPGRSVLIMVDPDARHVEVVTGDVVRRTLSDGEVDLAVLAMVSAFGEGDLVRGLTRGIAQLAEHARTS